MYSCILLLAFLCFVHILLHMTYSKQLMLQEPVSGAHEATLNAIRSRQFALKPVQKTEDGGIRTKVISA